MTPIKYLLLIDRMCFAVDHAGNMNPMFESIDRGTAELLFYALRDFHKVPAKIFDASEEKLIAVGPTP
jgi:hypothetical protein